MYKTEYEAKTQGSDTSTKTKNFKNFLAELSYTGYM